MSLRGAVGDWRACAALAFATGAMLTVLTVVLTLNVTIGLISGSAVGAALAACAVWGLLVVWSATLAFWSVLVDPRRSQTTTRDRLRLAGVLLLTSPLRVRLLVVLAGAVLAVSAVLFAPLFTVSVAFIALITTRYVLPAVDRLEGRATELVPE